MLLTVLLNRRDFKVINMKYYSIYVKYIPPQLTAHFVIKLKPKTKKNQQQFEAIRCGHSSDSISKYECIHLFL